MDMEDGEALNNDDSNHENKSNIFIPMARSSIEEKQQFEHINHLRSFNPTSNSNKDTHVGFLSENGIDMDAGNIERSSIGCPRVVVIVIGAGLSGLACAHELISRKTDNIDYQVIVLEANNEPGGRIRSATLANGVHVDLGGMFIHGTTSNPVSESVRLCGADVFQKKSCIIYDSDGYQISPDVDRRVEKIFNVALSQASARESAQASWLNMPERMESVRKAFEIELDKISNQAQNHPSSSPIPSTSASSSFLFGRNSRNFYSSSSSAKHDEDEDVGHPSHENGDSNKSSINSRENGMENGLANDKGPASPVTDYERRIINWHIANLEYSNNADLSQVNNYGWDQDDMYAFKGPHCIPTTGGFKVMMEAYAHSLDVRYNKQVTRITYNADGVWVETQDGETLEGFACVVTVPLGVLKQKTIEFVPELPKDKQDVIDRLGFGVLDKVFLLFEHIFWTASDFFGYASEQHGEFPIFIDLSDAYQSPVLCVLISGSSALKMEEDIFDFEGNGEEDDEISIDGTEDMEELFRKKKRNNERKLVKQIMVILRKIFPEDITDVCDPIDFVFSSWRKNEYSYGSYSYIALGSQPSDYDKMAQPVCAIVDNALNGDSSSDEDSEMGEKKGPEKIFFAGEATNKQYPASMHGAYYSGVREGGKVAENIKEQLKFFYPNEYSDNENDQAKAKSTSKNNKDEKKKSPSKLKKISPTKSNKDAIIGPSWFRGFGNANEEEKKMDPVPHHLLERRLVKVKRSVRSNKRVKTSARDEPSLLESILEEVEDDKHNPFEIIESDATDSDEEGYIEEGIVLGESQNGIKDFEDLHTEQVAELKTIGTDNIIDHELSGVSIEDIAKENEHIDETTDTSTLNNKENNTTSSTNQITDDSEMKEAAGPSRNVNEKVIVDNTVENDEAKNNRSDEGIANQIIRDEVVYNLSNEEASIEKEMENEEINTEESTNKMEETNNNLENNNHQEAARTRKGKRINLNEDSSDDMDVGRRSKNNRKHRGGRVSLEQTIIRSELKDEVMIPSTFKLVDIMADSKFFGRDRPFYMKNIRGTIIRTMDKAAGTCRFPPEYPVALKKVEKNIYIPSSAEGLSSTPSNLASNLVIPLVIDRDNYKKLLPNRKRRPLIISGEIVVQGASIKISENSNRSVNEMYPEKFDNQNEFNILAVNWDYPYIVVIYDKEQQICKKIDLRFESWTTVYEKKSDEDKRRDEIISNWLRKYLENMYELCIRGVLPRQLSPKDKDAPKSVDILRFKETWLHNNPKNVLENYDGDGYLLLRKVVPEDDIKSFRRLILNHLHSISKTFCFSTESGNVLQCSHRAGVGSVSDKKENGDNKNVHWRKRKKDMEKRMSKINDIISFIVNIGTGEVCEGELDEDHWQQLFYSDEFIRLFSLIERRIEHVADMVGKAFYGENISDPIPLSNLRKFAWLRLTGPGQHTRIHAEGIFYESGRDDLYQVIWNSLNEGKSTDENKIAGKPPVRFMTCCIPLFEILPENSSIILLPGSHKFTGFDLNVENRMEKSLSTRDQVSSDSDIEGSSDSDNSSKGKEKDEKEKKKSKSKSSKKQIIDAPQDTELPYEFIKQARNKPWHVGVLSPGDILLMDHHLVFGSTMNICNRTRFSIDFPVAIPYSPNSSAASSSSSSA